MNGKESHAAENDVEKTYVMKNPGISASSPFRNASKIVFTDIVAPDGVEILYDLDEDGDGGIVRWTVDDILYVSTQKSGTSIIAPNSCDGLFYSSTVTEIVFDAFDTSNVEIMSSVFYDCRSLLALDLSSFDTSNVTKMNSMFRYCSKITTLDLSNFDTSSVRNMHNMFTDCSSLTSLDISGFDTSNVSYMYSMFDGCSSLSCLDLSSFDTSKVPDMSYMFQNCSSLVSIDLSSFDTTNVTDMSYMFKNCSKLTVLDLSSFDTSKVTGMGYMFYDCYALESLDISNFDTSNVSSMYSMFYRCYTLDSLDVSGFDTSNVTSMASMFESCRNLSFLDLSSWDTSNVTTMTSMFYGCFQLQNINLFHMNTSKIAYMNSMFYNCSSLTSLDVSGLNTINVTTMNSMFYNCSSLTSLDISNLNTSKVTNMSYMFYKCSKLTSLDVSNLNTSNVVNMSSMFSTCTRLISLDVSNFDTRKVQSTNSMFYNCYKLEYLNLSDFNTSEVTDMSYMFCACSSLPSLDVSSFDTRKVQNTGYMFSQCSKVSSLDLSNWRLSSISSDTKMNRMFSSCSSLTTIYASPKTVNPELEITTSSVFSGCTNLVGGEGTLFSSNHLSAEYARIDEASNGLPGYFTLATVQDEQGTLISGKELNSKIPSSATHINITSEQFAFFNGCVDLSVELNKTYVGYLDENNVFWIAPNKNNKLVLPSDMNQAFRSKNIQGIKFAANGIDTSQVTDFSYMFQNCRYLETIDLSIFDFQHASGVLGMFSSCTALKEIIGLENIGRDIQSLRSMFYNCSNLESVDLSSWNVSNVIDTAFMFYSCKNLQQISSPQSHFEKLQDATSMFSNCESLSTVSVESITSPDLLTLHQTFYGCSKLKNIVGLDCLNTASVTDMRAMFYNCNALENVVGIENFDTSKVEDMAFMFSGCSSLSSIELKNFNTSSVTTLNTMFQSCQSLVSLDLSSFDTSKAGSLNHMFYGCSKLKTLDLSSFDTSNVSLMYSMFYKCSSLETVDLSSFNTSKVSNMNGMFYDCSSLQELDLSSFDTSSVVSSSSFIDNCPNLKTVYATRTFIFPKQSSTVISGASSLVGGQGTPFTSDRTSYEFARVDDANCGILGLFTEKNTSTEFIPPNGTLISGQELNQKIPPETIAVVFSPTPVEWNDAYDMDDLSVEGNRSYIGRNINGTYLIAPAYGYGISLPKSMAGAFANKDKILSVNFAGIMTSNVEDINGMFAGCTSLKSCYLDKFDISKLDNLDSLFSGCASLTSISGLNDIGHDIHSIDNLFAGCSNLKEINDIISDWDTSKITTMSAVFKDCSSIVELDISKWDASKAMNASELFAGATSLTSLTLPETGFLSLMNAERMFYNLRLGTLDFSAISESPIENAVEMFAGAMNITEDPLEQMNLSALKYADKMLFNMSQVKSIDVTGINMSTLESASQMFDGMYRVETFQANESWRFLDGCVLPSYIASKEKTSNFRLDSRPDLLGYSPSEMFEMWDAFSDEDKNKLWVRADRSIGNGTSGKEVTIQYYANIEVLATSGTNKLELINTTGKLMPTNRGSTSTRPNSNPLKYIYVDNSGNVQTKKTLTEIYSSESHHVADYSMISMYDIFKQDVSQSYKTSEIWFLKNGKKTTSTSRSDWDIVNIAATSAELIVFANDIDTVAISDGVINVPSDIAAIRYVAESNYGTYDNDTTFYDYDISNGKIYRTNIEGQTDAYINNLLYQQAGAVFTGDAINQSFITWGKGNAQWDKGIYTYTKESGINTSTNYAGTGTALAFGNVNTGTGLGTKTWTKDGYANRLNRYNNRGYLGCTFGLAASLDSRGRIIWSSGIDAPDLFGDRTVRDLDMTGRTTLPQYSLNFNKSGNTYTLSAVNGTSTTNLSQFTHPSNSGGTYDGVSNSAVIWTNNFWPMDSAPTYSTNGHDIKFGSTATFKNKTYQLKFGPNSSESASGDYNFPESDDGKYHNSYFGMKYQVDFDLTSNYIGPLEYYFFGDDDMWVFLSEVDNNGLLTNTKLVCDIGGVHSSIGEYVNIRNYLPNGTSGHYRLSFFYTERGASGSTCYMQFTLPAVAQLLTGASLEFQKVDSTDVSTPLTNAVFALSPAQDFSSNVEYAQSGADGKVSFNALADGTYYLQEMTAPSGYLKSEDIYEVIVSDGQVTSFHLLESQDENVLEALENGSIFSQKGHLITEEDEEGNVSYKITNEPITISGKKYMSDGSPVGSHVFTFELQAGEKGENIDISKAAVDDSSIPVIAINDEDGLFEFYDVNLTKENYSYTPDYQTYYHRFILSEVEGDDPELAYDKTKYLIEFTSKVFKTSPSLNIVDMKIYKIVAGKPIAQVDKIEFTNTVLKEVELPQTGSFAYLIPMLAIGGLLFAAGYVMYRRAKKKNKELTLDSSDDDGIASIMQPAYDESPPPLHIIPHQME